MDYAQTLNYLFDALPMFQRIGAAAFKNDLSDTLSICAHLGNPESKFKSIHIAGTNGKGSSSHAICSILMEAGCKVGLYTSPHLKSFTERIKINGNEIPKQQVVAFVEANKDFIDNLKPSFFEMTVGMAFWYFAKEQVDFAVIEVGMGGRLDSTNVIDPELCLITNIGLDHMQFLGDTVQKIAEEKAGIIKEGIPVVISQKQEEIAELFKKKGVELNAPVYFAQEKYKVGKIYSGNPLLSRFLVLIDGKSEIFEMDLLGNYQTKNLTGILAAIDILNEKGFGILIEDVKNGLKKIVPHTGLKGRWQILDSDPMVICDTGHNEDAFKYILEQLVEIPYENLHLVLGIVNDKDFSKILAMLPKKAFYYFCQADIPRALPAEELAEMAKTFDIHGEVIPDVNLAIEAARMKAGKEDVIFVGGSTFVVAEINNL